MASVQPGLLVEDPTGTPGAVEGQRWGRLMPARIGSP